MKREGVKERKEGYPDELEENASLGARDREPLALERGLGALFFVFVLTFIVDVTKLIWSSNGATAGLREDGRRPCWRDAFKRKSQKVKSKKKIYKTALKGPEWYSGTTYIE